MAKSSHLLTLDSNVFIAALKGDEPDNERCCRLLSKVPDDFILSEPSIVYEEVCGTLARRVGMDVADEAKKQLDLIIHPELLADCDRTFCFSTYSLCAQYMVYAIDAIYLKVALDSDAVLVSLDKEDFIDRVKSKPLDIEAYHISEFPY